MQAAKRRGSRVEASWNLSRFMTLFEAGVAGSRAGRHSRALRARWAARADALGQAFHSAGVTPVPSVARNAKAFPPSIGCTSLIAAPIGAPSGVLVVLLPNIKGNDGTVLRCGVATRPPRPGYEQYEQYRMAGHFSARAKT